MWSPSPRAGLTSRTGYARGAQEVGEMAEPIELAQMTYTHQRTGIGIVFQSQDDLDQLVAALQDPAAKSVTLKDHYGDIAVSIYFRFRE